MTESIAQQIEDPNKREEFSDDLERYVAEAADEISRLAGEMNHDTVGEEYFRLRVNDILMENIYIPVILGEEKNIRVATSDLNNE